MILHVVTFLWRPDVTNADVEAVLEGLSSLPAQIPELRDYRFGPDLGLREGNAHFGVTALLDGPEDVDAYLDHPAHQQVVTEILGPLIVARQALQFEVTQAD